MAACGVRNLLGVYVYSFMCIALPAGSLLPVSLQRPHWRLVFLDYVLILSVLRTPLLHRHLPCFRGDRLLDMYTLNRAAAVVGLAAVRFFLGLFRLHHQHQLPHHRKQPSATTGR